MDAKLIFCIVVSGLFLILIGISLILVYVILEDQFEFVRPTIVIGPVLVGGGLAVLLCSGGH